MSTISPRYHPPTPTRRDARRLAETIARLHHAQCPGWQAGQPCEICFRLQARITMAGADERERPPHTGEYPHAT